MIEISNKLLRKICTLEDIDRVLEDIASPQFSQGCVLKDKLTGEIILVTTSSDGNLITIEGITCHKSMLRPLFFQNKPYYVEISELLDFDAEESTQLMVVVYKGVPLMVINSERNEIPLTRGGEIYNNWNEVLVQAVTSQKLSSLDPVCVEFFVGSEVEVRNIIDLKDYEIPVLLQKKILERLLVVQNQNAENSPIGGIKLAMNFSSTAWSSLAF